MLDSKLLRRKTRTLATFRALEPSLAAIVPSSCLRFDVEGVAGLGITSPNRGFGAAGLQSVFDVAPEVRRAGIHVGVVARTPGMLVGTVSLRCLSTRSMDTMSELPAV